ncbi:hypothetical protein KBD11_01805 [Candidatus Saccharibacteria bacterium]|nr:hypothetical protein [Candidatus Saccharibacteria bacterium]
MDYLLPKTFDANLGMLIPRSHFRFDPKRIGQADEFSITFIESDTMASSALQVPLESIPEPSQNSMTALLETVPTVEHEGAKLVVENTDRLVVVRFGFTPLPALDESHAPTSFMERAQWRRQQVAPIAQGWSQVFKILPQLTNLQYQFGVPEGQYDTSHSPSPARWSYANGENINQPRVIVTEAFDKTLKGIKPAEANALTIELEEYLVALGVASGRGTEPFSGCIIGNYDRIFSNGQSSLGQRDDGFTPDDLASQKTLVDHRLQSGDKYEARGHNLSDISIPQWLAMISVGALSGITLDGQTAS